ncbi:MAG: response regulator [bacterium]|nr:response regulator [bacterium]
MFCLFQSMTDIAILEDDRNIRVSLGMYLEHEGYTVITYGNPLKALSELISFPPRLLVLNGRMPGMHGIDVFLTFREYSQSPVVFLSASVDEIEAKLEAIGKPAEGYVLKPFWQSELLEIAARYIQPIMN